MTPNFFCFFGNSISLPFCVASLKQICAWERLGVNVLKQRHIPQYNYIKRQQQKNPCGIDKMNAAHVLKSKNCKILLFPTADRRFDTKAKYPTGRVSFWVKFPTVWSSTRVKCPGIAREGGGGGGRWTVLELTGTYKLHSHL